MRTSLLIAVAITLVSFTQQAGAQTPAADPSAAPAPMPKVTIDPAPAALSPATAAPATSAPAAASADANVQSSGPVTAKDNAEAAPADQGFVVALADTALVVDHVLHPRLRHRRVFAFVVAATAVAQHVDDDVLLELLPEVHRQLGHPDAGFRVVTVDVKDRRTNHFRDVGAVFAGAGMLR